MEHFVAVDVWVRAAERSERQAADARTRAADAAYALYLSVAKTPSTAQRQAWKRDDHTARNADILRRFSAGESRQDIARFYGITVSRITLLVNTAAANLS